MSTFQVVNPFQQFFGLDGLPLTGGYVYIGTAGGDPETSPIPVYSDQALSVPIAQPLRTVGGYLIGTGTPANAYPSTTPYSIRVRRQQGSSPGTEVFYVPVVHDEIAEALAALLASLNASNVTYNPGVTGAVARTVQDEIRERVSLLDFYTATDPDLTIAANKFISYANSAGGYKTCMVPNRYPLGTSTLTTITADHVYFDGPKSGGFILSANAPAFHYSGSFGGGMRNILLTYSGAPGASAAVALLDGGCGNTKWENLTVRSIGRLLTLGSTTAANGTFIRNIDGDVYNGGRSTIELVKGAGVFMDGALAVAGVGNPAIDRTSTMTTLAGTNLINLAPGSSWDTVVMEMFAERFFRAANIVTSAGAIFSNFTGGLKGYGDYIRNDCFRFESQDSSSGGIFGVDLFGYANSWEGCALNVLGPGVNRDGRVNLRSTFSGTDGLSFNGANTRQWQLGDCSISHSDRLNTGKTALRINAPEIDVDGGYYGQLVAGGGTPWQPPYGVTIAADLDLYSVEGVTAYGATGKFSIAANAAGFPNRRVNGNLNADYAGLQAGGIFVRPASTVAWTNTTPHDVEIFIGNGTVTQISINGAATGMTNASFTCAPGDFFAVTYSVAPACTFKVLP